MWIRNTVTKRLRKKHELHTNQLFEMPQDEEVE